MELTQEDINFLKLFHIGKQFIETKGALNFHIDYQSALVCVFLKGGLMFVDCYGEVVNSHEGD